MLRTATLIALAGFAAAQIPGLSSQCTSAIAGIVANADASACLQPAPLLSLVTSGGNADIVGPINNWLNGMCAAAPCSNDTLAAITRNVTAGCQTEFGIDGSDSSTVANTIIPIVQQYYPTVRKVVCLKDNGNNCVTELLQSMGGNLTINGVISMFTSDNGPLMNMSNVTCSNCVKAAYNIINTDIPSIVSDAGPGLQAQCGANFTDGTTPSGISQSARDASSGSSGSSNNSTGAGALLVSSLTTPILGVAAVVVGVLF